MTFQQHVPERDVPERDVPERDVPERDVPERDVSLRGILIKIGPRMERDVRDRIKRHLKRHLFFYKQLPFFVSRI